ncbi:040e235b-4539-4777-bd7f-6c0c9d2a8b8c [Thermothielavioides terrestris]|uniref:Tyrosinase copper-binding domain-containing protein n=2 Tax=Thermothielavioides terrestris TaxID=2587410 RepID=G2R0R5_THETT|nr:uncharacterized protein THITE_2088815 [Thermothielavioides terrestris NRRL 8126]AEO67326.1 hypothetical protein THITE_2088815 [Thermothielavioides terrestris NRRL 8126]SPQ24035.1 040e235b-4539-4777-bd7f-6c0c9d2a8b8c [Thermothielavioides terrestris]
MWTIRGVLVLAQLLVGASADYRSKIEVIRNPAFPLDVVDKLEEDTMAKVEAYMAKKIAAGKNNGCTLENAAVRREWSDLSNEQREEYIAAVQCLMKLPPRAPKDRFPGALSRFDDFVAYHMSHAAQLHDPLHLFPAHKQFLYVYEQALRNECNYTGYQPYENYDRYARDPIHSPLFNGNASSMGGNGAPDPQYTGLPQPGRTPNIIKSGGGGGCVTEGPFKDMVVSLGPTSMSPYHGLSIPKNPRSDGTGSNPRCLRRDVNRNAAMGATADRAYSLITNNSNIDGFYNQLLGNPPPKNDPYPWGIHTAGHYIHALDPGGDPATSPGDPVFYFHHGAIDRLWWIWQMQDPDARLNAVPTGGGGMPGMPGMGGGSAQDPSTAVIDLEWLAGPIKLLEAHDQLGGNGGAFCYVYV